MVHELVGNLSGCRGLMRIENPGLLYPTPWTSPLQKDTLDTGPLFVTLTIPVLAQCCLINITPFLIDYFGTLFVLYCTAMIILGAGLIPTTSILVSVSSIPVGLTLHPSLNNSGYVQPHFFFLG